MEENRPLQAIPDDELLQRLTSLVGQSRRVEADVVAHISEVEKRKLYAREAFPSMFAYGTNVLHLSGAEAYLRISAARASRKHPMLLTMLADGRLHLTAIAKLAPHLTRENRDGLLARATHRSKRQIEELIAEIAPRPDVPAVMRKLPERRTLPSAGLLAVPSCADGPIPSDQKGQDVLGPGPTVELRPDGAATLEPGARRDHAAVSPNALPTHAPSVLHDASTHANSQCGSASPASPSAAATMAPAVVQPLSPGRYRVQFTASAEFHRKLERLQALGSRVPDGSGCDLAAVIEQAVTEKLERLEARRFARTKALRKRPAETDPSRSSLHVPAEPMPSPSSRHIPATVRRAVNERDGGRCRYVDKQGRRCQERNRLEFHHRHPFALGGDHSVENVRLMCRAHNAYLAECDYGSEAMVRHRDRPGRAAKATAG
jgi:5-methylcytosine-specific restriction endonuclease McrA